MMVKYESTTNCQACGRDTFESPYDDPVCAGCEQLTEDCFCEVLEVEVVPWDWMEDGG